MTDSRTLFNPTLYGLPSHDELVEMRIWDGHYHGVHDRSERLNHEQLKHYFDQMGVERVFSLDIGRLNSQTTPADAKQNARDRLDLAESEKHRLSGMFRIDPTRVDATLEFIEIMIVDGPCVGIKTGTRHSEPITVAHRNYDPIVRRLAELEAVIYIHTSYMVGGEPRTYYEGTRTGESHPGHVAELAQRHPDIQMICGHQGGDWELGIRAIRPYENVFLEFSGMNPESGAVDFAVNELGVDRLVWGCHAPTRSFANELSKVYDGDLSDDDRKKILGGNLRMLSATIHRRKGIPVDI